MSYNAALRCVEARGAESPVTGIAALDEAVQLLDVAGAGGGPGEQAVSATVLETLGCDAGLRPRDRRQAVEISLAGGVVVTLDDVDEPLVGRR